MEHDRVGINHLDGDVLLPPRKRLLAGLKKQKSADNSNLPLSGGSSAELNIPSSNLLASYLSDPNVSLEYIAEASKAAAAAAIKAAETARAAAEEKASISVKAIAAAKSALEMVASFSEQAAFEDTQLKKSKLKKHIPVQLLYKKHQPVEICKNDEELALKLHRDMNRSPRILKKHKKPKIMPTLQKASGFNEGLSSMSNGHATTSPEGFIVATNTCEADQRASKSDKQDQIKMGNGDAEAGNSLENISVALDELCAIGKKRGRIKLKKLPLSLCASRDQANYKEDMKYQSPALSEENPEEPVAHHEVSSAMMEAAAHGAHSVQAAEAWKCQASELPKFMDQKNVMQSG